MKENIADSLGRLAEVKLVYSTNIKPTERIKIQTPEDAFKVFWEVWDKEIIEHIEESKLLLLNRANRVLGYVNLAKGGVNGCVIDTKVVLQYALKSNASGVILAHNHPSSNLEPSDSDKMLTDELKRALSHIGISLLDHLIITSDEVYKSILDFI